MYPKKLTVTIITLNEEKNIARAVASSLFADEVLIVDSQSSDRTCDIAQKMGAKVITQPFLGYGQQKNFAESQAESEWIFNLDADEEISPQLQRSITQIMNSQTPHSCFSSARLNHYCGQPIHHGGWYPDFNARLYRKGKARWSEPSVHEVLRPLDPSEPIGKLEGDIYHYSFPSVKSQVQTNILYASLGAKQWLKQKRRRPYLLELLFRPLFKFFECYILKRGFQDGVRGLIIAINAAHSMFMKYSFALLDNNIQDQ